jgi:hypothetical protein
VVTGSIPLMAIGFIRISLSFWIRLGSLSFFLFLEKTNVLWKF